jgi:hypothetical protein
MDMPPLLDTQGDYRKTERTQVISHHLSIREMLRENEDGMTAGWLAEFLSLHVDSVRGALAKMPDAYIDRWTKSPKGKTYEAIWCVVVPPENCPKPTRK